MTIAEAQQEIVEEFAFLGDWEERYAHIIDLGRAMEPIADERKTETNRVKGCQSQVWLHSEMQDDILHLEAESDALIVNGLIALLMRVYADRTPAEILAADNQFIDKVELRKHLSPNRTNGLASMLATIRRRAAVLAGAGPEETGT